MNLLSSVAFSETGANPMAAGGAHPWSGHPMGEARDAPTAAGGPVGSNLFDLLAPMTGKPLTRVRGRMNSTPREKPRSPR